MKTKSTIRNCLPVFSFRCPQNWDRFLYRKMGISMQENNVGDLSCGVSSRSDNPVPTWIAISSILCITYCPFLIYYFLLSGLGAELFQIRGGEENAGERGAFKILCLFLFGFPANPLILWLSCYSWSAGIFGGCPNPLYCRTVFPGFDHSECSKRKEAFSSFKRHCSNPILVWFIHRDIRYHVGDALMASWLFPILRPLRRNGLSGFDIPCVERARVLK